MNTGVKDGDDVHPEFLFGSFVVERWREALLWSWIVGSVGGVNDEWEDVNAQTAWEELGGEIDEASILVEITQRDSLDRRRVEQLARGGSSDGREKNSMSTAYSFSEWSLRSQRSLD